ncbi:MAG: 30S ribosomal protein S9 [candidate division WOR-3 bacterium]
MDAQRFVFAAGSRKRARARARVKEPGHGWIYVNGKRPLAYFGREDLVIKATEPLTRTGLAGKVDVAVKLDGGGLSGQAGAMRLAIARCIARLDERYLEVLKKEGFMGRDPREKERMKYGRTKRRRSWQYSKR